MPGRTTTGRRAWRRPPRRRSPAGASPAFSAARWSSIVAPTVRPSARDRALHLGALRVGGERQHEEHRRRTRAPASTAGLQRAEAEVRGDGERVGEERRVLVQEGRRVGGHGGADVAALGVHQRPARRPPAPPRRPSPVRRCRASRTARRRRDCGLRTATRSASASTTVRVKRSRPATSSFRPQAASREACGSMPTQSGPAGVHGAAQPGAEGFESVTWRPPSGSRRRPRRRGWRTGWCAAARRGPCGWRGPRRGPRR